ncbi:UNVERIFIED_CONTAM: hypothetical protein Sindi_2651600 [Sesamum indicum]
MYAVTRKLKSLKSVFREQRRKKGDLSHNVQLAKGFLEMAQLLVSSNRQEELFLQLEHYCRIALAKVAKLEQIMLQQRAKMQWMKGGDQCSRVFFSRRDAIDLRFLRPWARHILSDEDANSLLVPFTPEDVKHAVFDIAEDKASGPDGYSSGRILKQINTTLLALIPKVHSPTTVGDFRPISCCNVLYKIIAKLIVQRLSVILDKLISPCQAAFVPGRSIGDNIMLAQELFMGYNQAHRPPRCALKVDIRKAYDTLFGFPDTFVKWIEACVTTPSFSIGLNGKPHGFFKGARGLRQGDPLSPYLFVLMMEVLRLGLRLNVQKSHLIISRSAQGLREEMLAALGFQEGVLPMKYLGLPLLSSRLTIADCRRLLLKIDKRYCWLGRDNNQWLRQGSLERSFYTSLTPRTSDHSPLVLYGDSQQQYGGMFRFDNYLTLPPEFIPSVQQIWQHNIIGAPMYAVTRKLKAPKPVFREQRRNKGDLSHNVQLAKGFLEMAQLLVSSNRQDELLLQLEHCCRFILAKAAKLEQSMLQQRAKMQWMKGGDQCSRVFFRKIAQRRSARRILQINDDHGATHTEPQEVVNEFVMYYQNLLGGEQRRDVIDLRFLRPWVRHLLSEEDVNSLLLPFTPADVKQAVFDIAEDKAPGPDGYSSGFFKAAWPIVGQEVTSAVLDFFNTG